MTQPGKIKKLVFAALSVSALILSVLSLALKHQSPYDSLEVRAPEMVGDLNSVLVNSSVTDLETMDNKFERFLTRWNIHGASLAITRNDSLVYVKGYGVSDGLDSITPGTKFRLASVSKLVTATGIMVLRDRGQLMLCDKVFGPEGILGNEPYATVIKDPRYYQITIEDLLRHKGGFSSRGGDPMFPSEEYLARNHFDHFPDRDEMLRCVLSHRLYRQSGTTAEYSNFGFLLLSLIIEKITGQDYERWMQDNVLHPCGCIDFHIAGNFLEDRYPGETVYHCQEMDTLTRCIDGSKRLVERCYGGSNITALSGAGAWVASTAELARFVCSIDGIPGVEDIISSEGLDRMTETTDSVSFGIGWNDISEDGVWTRTGTLSCTSALVKRYGDGECWILVTNTGTWKGPRFTKYISYMFKESRELYSSLLPDINLFEVQPTLHPSPDMQ